MLEQVESIAYKLGLPQELSRVHNTFHVSNLRKYYADEPLAVPLDELHFDDKLRFVKKPAEIMDREVKRLRQSRVPIVKVRWNSRRGPDQVIDKFKTGLGYNAVSSTAASPAVEIPPPFTGNFIPRKPDLTFMDEIFESENMDVTTIVTPSNVKRVESNHESAGVKSNGDAVEPKTVRMNNFRPPVIEDWNSDDESEIEFIPNVEEKKLFEHLHYVCDKKVMSLVWNNSSRVNHKNFANKMTHPHPNRRFVPQAVLTKSGKINTAGASVNTAVRPVNTAGSKPIVNTVRVKDTTARDIAVVSENKGKRVNAVKALACCNPQQKEYKEKGVIDSGCLRHMIGNKCYLTEYEDYDGGFVSFGDGKGRISGKVLLRVPRKDNIYSIDLKSVVPTNGLTCLFAKAIVDESKLWHRRLGHINFKNMNKLVRGNFVRGLPSKIFENDHSCVASQKGKQGKASNQTNGIAGTRDNIVTGQAEKKTEPEQEYIQIPICITDPLISQDPKVSEEDAEDKPTKMDESGALDKDEKDDHTSTRKAVYNTTKDSNAFEEHLFERFSPFKNAFTLPPVSNVTPMDDNGTRALETRRTNYKDYQNCLFACFLSQLERKKVIQALEDPSWIEAMQEELLQFQLQKVWTLLNLRPYIKLLEPGMRPCLHGFRRGTIDKTLFIKKDKGLMYKRFEISSIRELTFFLGLQVQQKKDGIFISQDKYVADILKKFDFPTVKTASTPMEPNKALVKDEEADSVDVHLYRSMNLIASRPDIMFAVCAYARFKVTLKMLHLYAVKRIFRYLKGQPKLGLWYPRDSPFNLEAFFDSDYAGASLDRKSTIGGCQFLGKRLISWQCKKQTIVANYTTESEYVAATNCCGLVLWIQNQMLDYGFNFMNTQIFIDNESTICIVKNLVFYSKTKHIKIRHHFIRDCYEKKLIQVIKIHTDHNVADLLTKAFDVSRNQSLFHHHINPKKTHKPRKTTRTTEISQFSGSINLVAYETVYKEWEDRMKRAVTTASSLDAEQDSGNINRIQSMATLNESFP
ncbi:putative ribonuclease H-like domain-containing protein [Tanacetum coccineum]